MPLVSAHVFASHIGHTGKTTLCFQTACSYAARHPTEAVLVADFAEEGDCTKRLLGGVDSSRGKVEELFGSVFGLLSAAKNKGSGLTGWLLDRGTIDISQYAIHVAEHNGHIPSNVFLISSGAWERSEEELSDAVRQDVCSKILAALRASDRHWKLFCDTDGDRRPSPFTLLAYGLCPHAIIPLHLSKADWDRTETMLYMLNDLRQRGVVSTQVQFAVWNIVKVLKDEPCEQHGICLPFTPTKVSCDILRVCNKRMLAAARDLPGLFVHEAMDDVELIKNSVLVFRQLADNVLKPSEELGWPVVDMMQSLMASGKQQMRFRSGDVEYDSKVAVVRVVDESVSDMSRKLEALSLQGCASK